MNALHYAIIEGSKSVLLNWDYRSRFIVGSKTSVSRKAQWTVRQNEQPTVIWACLETLSLSDETEPTTKTWDCSEWERYRPD